MTDFAGPFISAPIFSPDYSRFVVVVRKGNLERNTVEYSILLWRTSDASESRRPTVVATFSSSSNRAAVADLRWLNSDTITFLAENPGEERELYKLDVNTNLISRLTQAATSVMAYSMSADGDTTVFGAEQPYRDVFTIKDQQRGFRIGTQSLTALVTGKMHSTDLEMFALKRESGKIVRLKIAWRISSVLFSGLSLSPDGRLLVVPMYVGENAPAKWKEYQSWPPPDHQFVLVHTDTGESEPLIDAPMSALGAELIWLPNSQSVVISHVYLPLNLGDPAERELRKSKTFTAEVVIQSRTILPIEANEDLRVTRWDSAAQAMVFEVGQHPGELQGKRDEFFYAKNNGRWERVSPPTKVVRSTPDIHFEEDLNDGPRIVMADPNVGRKTVLMDLNPQFKGLQFGLVQEITWKATDGHEVKGGLYLPPDYARGSRYPLIIQTHGWYPKMFFVSMDGFPAPPSAAQALAARGFVVVQVPLYGDSGSDMVSLNGTKKEVSAYEGVVEYLDSAGLIDRNRVGIVGFSWTCLTVKYALTHSHYHFGAAALSDGPDAGYFQYILASNTNPAYLSQVRQLNEAAPFGAGLHTWLKNSPGFALDQVSTPVLIEAVEGVDSLLWEWEWFGGLTALRKPVDMLYLAQGAHELVKPWERMTAQQTSVDWFCFWLKGEEDSDPAKTEQYARWRELRKLQEQNAQQPQEANPPSVH